MAKIMIYMTPQSSPPEKLSAAWGQIMTPGKSGHSIPSGRLWCMDNGVFTGKFKEATFWKKLTAMRAHQSTCVFVVAPDVVANAIATMNEYRYWGCRLQADGWRVAFVAQDGQELFPFPPEFDCLFVGGSTNWKMSDAAMDCIRRAQAIGKWVHVGRVNSQKRMRHFQLAGVDSVDGTTVCFAPNENYLMIERQLHQKPLFRL